MNCCSALVSETSVLVYNIKEAPRALPLINLASLEWLNLAGNDFSSPTECYVQVLEFLLSERKGAPQMQFILAGFIPRVIIAILLYGCESWRMTKGEKKRRDVVLRKYV